MERKKQERKEENKEGRVGGNRILKMGKGKEGNEAITY